MPASSQRKGRKLNRPTLCGPRTPACTCCQQRRVKCDGGSPCTACVRKAAWDGVPPPTSCEYDGRARPAPPSHTAPSTSAPLSRRKGKSRALSDTDDELDDEDEAMDADDEEHRPSRAGGRKSRKEGGGAARGAGSAACGAGEGRPLQKGLACLACKTRRVRCDGGKPACTACVKLAQAKGVDVRGVCQYRADLWAKRRREEQEKRGGVKEEEEEDEELPPVPKKDTTPRPFVLPKPEFLPPLPILPSQLPPLPPLPPLPQQAVAPPPPQPQPAPTTCSLSSLHSSIFPSLPFPHSTSVSSTSSAFPHPASGLFSQPSTAPPSPSLSFTLSSSAYDYENSSGFPSPRTPLDDFTLRLFNYPPQPYPSVKTVNPFWTTSPLTLAPALGPAAALELELDPVSLDVVAGMAPQEAGMKPGAPDGLALGEVSLTLPMGPPGWA
ncbi:hypothetical protein JCM10207_002476 [Rhodosporidiobolus poonsookiae]